MCSPCLILLLFINFVEPIQEKFPVTSPGSLVLFTLVDRICHLYIKTCKKSKKWLWISLTSKRIICLPVIYMHLLAQKVEWFTFILMLMPISLPHVHQAFWLRRNKLWRLCSDLNVWKYLAYSPPSSSLNVDSESFLLCTLSHLFFSCYWLNCKFPSLQESFMLYNTIQYNFIVIFSILTIKIPLSSTARIGYTGTWLIF